MNEKEFNSMFYKCFSGKLKKWLDEKKQIKHVFKARNFIDIDKQFWLFERNDRLDNALKEWSKNNPNRRK